MTYNLGSSSIYPPPTYEVIGRVAGMAE
jgi:hypothetical protein